MKTIKGKVVLLDTNNMIGCLFSRKENHGITRHTIHTVMHDNYTGHELYITSDEEIKEGDWCYNPHLTNVYQFGKGTPQKDSKKIIATTDKSLNLPSIPQSFIDTYIEGYNKGNVIEDVEVEYYEPEIIPDELATEIFFDSSYFKSGIKTNSNNEISIKPSKTCWSKEEVEALCRDAYTLSFEDSRQELIGGSGEDYSIGTFIKENL